MTPPVFRRLTDGALYKVELDIANRGFKVTRLNSINPDDVFETPEGKDFFYTDYKFIENNFLDPENYERVAVPKGGKKSRKNRKRKTKSARRIARKYAY